MNNVVYNVVFFLVSVGAVNYSRLDEGYPVGFFSDCNIGSICFFASPQIKPETLKNSSSQSWVQVPCWKPSGLHTTTVIRDLPKHPNIDFNKRTFMYVAGYLDSTTLPLGRTLGEIYRNLGYNVLLVDILEFTAHYYSLAAQAVRPLGWHAAEMLANLTELGLDPKKLDLTGISLGGQPMSLIAKGFRELTGKNISSITALDPAGPCFRNLGPEERLDPSDADFVLNLVTNMDVFGMDLPVGHVTFYVNKGEYQPGDVWWLPCPVVCSHIKSYLYWLAALMYPHQFIGVKCDSVQQARDNECFDRKPKVTNTLDLYTDRMKPGIYYLQTSGKFPYFQGKKGLKKRSRKEIEKNM